MVRQTVERLFPLFSPRQTFVVTAKEHSDLVRRDLDCCPRRTSSTNPWGGTPPRRSAWPPRSCTGGIPKRSSPSCPRTTTSTIPSASSAPSERRGGRPVGSPGHVRHQAPLPRNVVWVSPTREPRRGSGQAGRRLSREALLRKAEDGGRPRVPEERRLLLEPAASSSGKRIASWPPSRSSCRSCPRRSRKSKPPWAPAATVDLVPRIREDPAHLDRLRGDGEGRPVLMVETDFEWTTSAPGAPRPTAREGRGRQRPRRESPGRRDEELPGDLFRPAAPGRRPRSRGLRRRSHARRDARLSKDRATI